MDGILTLPAECRLQIYGYYLQGVEPTLSIHYDRTIIEDEEDSSCRRTFEFMETKGRYPRSVSLSLLGVCRQIRHELFPFLGSSRPLKVQVWHYGKPYQDTEDMPADNVKHLDYGYINNVREIDGEPPVFAFGRVGLSLFPAVQRITARWNYMSLAQLRFEELPKITPDNMYQQEVLDQVTHVTVDLHAEAMKTLSSCMANAKCTLAAIFDIGFFSAKITKLQDGERVFRKYCSGSILVSHATTLLVFKTSADCPRWLKLPGPDRKSPR